MGPTHSFMYCYLGTWPLRGLFPFEAIELREQRDTSQLCLSCIFRFAARSRGMKRAGQSRTRTAPSVFGDR